MFVFFAKMGDTYTNMNLRGIFTAVKDPWTYKDIRNYGIFKDTQTQVIPNNHNKLSEARVWKQAQPGFLRFTP